MRCDDVTGLGDEDLDEIVVELPAPDEMCKVGRFVGKLEYVDAGDGREYSHEFTEPVQIIGGPGVLIFLGNFTLSDMGIEDGD